MAALAGLLKGAGHKVSGSDTNIYPPMSVLLENAGIPVLPGYRKENIKGDIDLVIVGNTVSKTNEEVQAVLEAGLDYTSFPGALSRFFLEGRKSLVVAGTHGKTTTTSLVASILTEGGLDPTFVIGGLLTSAGTNAGLGTSEYLVAEADESDGSFQLLQPVMAVVTNIDEDHMETFDNDLDQLKQSFSTFIHRVPFYGVTVLCVDDDHVYELAQNTSRHQITYGLTERAQVQAINLKQIKQHMWFDVLIDGEMALKQVKLNLPGTHNVLNALAAIAIGLELDVKMAAMHKALAEFNGVGRRFNIYADTRINDKSFTLIDDYAHHPTELAAAIKACQEGWPEQRLVLVFQPHRYSRTRDLFDDFADVLNGVDKLLITEVYPAGESVISGATANDLCRSIRNRGKLDPVFVHDIQAVPAAIAHVVEDDDVVLMLGAGNIGALIQDMLAELSAGGDQ